MSLTNRIRRFNDLGFVFSGMGAGILLGALMLIFLYGYALVVFMIGFLVFIIGSVLFVTAYSESQDASQAH